MTKKGGMNNYKIKVHKYKNIVLNNHEMLNCKLNSLFFKLLCRILTIYRLTYSC